MAAEERVYPNTPVEVMKLKSVEAGRLTKKYGMTAYTVAAWGKLKFDGDAMKMAVGRVMASSGGTGGLIRVVPSGAGSIVRVEWESPPDAKCTEATRRFWENLDAVLQPGGLKVAPRSGLFTAGIVLVILLAAYNLLAFFLTIVALATLRDKTDPVAAALAGFIAGDLVVTVFSVIAVVGVIRRRNLTQVLAFAGVLVFFYALGLIGLFAWDMADYVSVPEGILRLGAAIACLAIMIKVKPEYTYG